MMIMRKKSEEAASGKKTATFFVIQGSMPAVAQSRNGLLNSDIFI